MRPPNTFPDVIDSSMMASFKSCPQLFKKIYVDDWKSKEGKSVHLIAGGAYAKGLEVTRRAFYEGNYELVSREPLLDEKGLEVRDQFTGKPLTKLKSEWALDQPKHDTDTAQALGLQALLAFYGDFECPADSGKSAERTAGALEFCLERYPLNLSSGYPIEMPGGKRAIEVSFAHPLPINHPDTGNPLLYVGRSDMVCWYAGANYIEDDKTASQLGASWSRQWDLRGQFLGYTWGFRKADFHVAGVLVRGVSILKTKYDTQEAIANFSEFEVNRWYCELLEWICDMIRCYQTGRWRYNLDHACAEYGGCGFRSVCKSENEQPWLEQYFEKRRWDPVTREETLL